MISISRIGEAALLAGVAVAWLLLSFVLEVLWCRCFPGFTPLLLSLSLGFHPLALPSDPVTVSGP